jgi:hypothetical protein
VLIAVCGFQVYSAANKVPQYAEGYEEAARFVVKNQAGTVLYSAGVDDGYFVFFVRKYDEQKQRIVLLGDKILATSDLGVIVKDLISERWQIYEILNTYGVRYLVIEDVETSSKALAWLREEARTDRFILRGVIPIRSNMPRLHDARLMVYEYRDWRAAQKDAVIRIDVPLMGKEIAVRLADLAK